jgi:hypothetical protein
MWLPPRSGEEPGSGTAIWPPRSREATSWFHRCRQGSPTWKARHPPSSSWTKMTCWAVPTSRSSPGPRRSRSCSRFASTAAPAAQSIPDRNVPGRSCPGTPPGLGSRTRSRSFLTRYASRRACSPGQLLSSDLPGTGRCLAWQPGQAPAALNPAQAGRTRAAAAGGRRHALAGPQITRIR